MTARTEVLFVFICLIGMPLLRKLASALSQTSLYKAPRVIAIVLIIAWGAGIAFGFRHLVLWLQVGVILKAMGYCAAAYVSAGSYGYISETSAPDQPQRRHSGISQLSLLAFVIFSLIFGFTIS